MEMSLGAVRTAVLRHTLAQHPPDVLITIPRSSCRTLDFHKAEAMIDLGRVLAEEALDRDVAGSAARAAGAGGRAQTRGRPVAGTAAVVPSAGGSSTADSGFPEPIPPRNASRGRFPTTSL